MVEKSGMEVAVTENRDGNSRSETERVKKISWANVVNEKPSLSKHNFESRNSSGVVAVLEDVLVDPPLWEDLLIGQFVSKAPHVAKIHVIVNKIWPLGANQSR